MAESDARKTGLNHLGQMSNEPSWRGPKASHLPNWGRTTGGSEFELRVATQTGFVLRLRECHEPDLRQ